MLAHAQTNMLGLGATMRHQVELVADVRHWCRQNEVDFDDVVAYVITVPLSLRQVFGQLKELGRLPEAEREL